MNEIDTFIQHWTSTKKIGTKTVDEIFALDDIPLWNFYRRFFAAHVMPKPVNTFQAMARQEKISAIHRTRLKLASIVMPHYILRQENKKLRYFSQYSSQKKKYDGRKKILFLSYSNHLSADGKIFRLQNMIKKIKEDQKVESLVLFTDPLSSKRYQQLRERDTLYQYYDETIAQNAKIRAKELSQQWKSLSPEQKEGLLTMPNGRSLWPYLSYALELFFSYKFIYLAALYYGICSSIIKKENIPALVLTSQSGFFEKCFLAAAANIQPNISAFQIQHGIAAGILDTTYNTKRLVFSRSHKQELIDAGVQEKDIFVVGPIIFDDISRYQGKLAQTQKNILLASSALIEDGLASKEEYFERIERVLRAIEELSYDTLFIKLHPREQYQHLYEQLLQKSGFQNVKIIQHTSREEFYRLIQQCQLFINFGSTAAFEAILMDKPIVTINLSNLEGNIFRENHCTLVADSGATVTIQHSDDITEALNKALQEDALFSQKRKEFIRKYCYKMDGKAYERALDLIYDTINLKSQRT